MNAITKIGGFNDAGLLRQQALIGGVWQDAASGKTVDVIDPASQSVLGTVPDMSGAETRAAIEAIKSELGDSMVLLLGTRSGGGRIVRKDGQCNRRARFRPGPVVPWARLLARAGAYPASAARFPPKSARGVTW